MPLTTIKMVQNKTSQPVSIKSLEDPRLHLTVLPGERVEFDKYVPWARDADEFVEHHIELAIPADSTQPYCIWQYYDDQDARGGGEGDHIRFSADGTYHYSKNGEPGEWVTGISFVGVTLVLLIDSTVPNGFSLEYYTDKWDGTPKGYIRH
jgi:hypothetical protein